MKRRALTGGERADWLRLSRTRGIGPITFFHLLERYGAADEVLADLPALAKKAGGKADVRAPSVDDINREIEAADWRPPTLPPASRTTRPTFPPLMRHRR